MSETWYEVQYSAWHEDSGTIFRTPDFELAQQIAEPHGHVILVMPSPPKQAPHHDG